MKIFHNPFILALLAVLLWSTVGSAFSLSLRHLNFVQLLFYANFIAVIFLGITILLRDKTEFRQSLVKINIIRSSIMGFLNPFAYYLVLLKAYSILPAQKAVSLNYIWPVTLVLLSIPVLKQKITFLSLIFMLISFMGTVIIATQGKPWSLEFSNPLGTFLALSSSVFWAVYWLMNMKDQRDAISKIFLNFSFGFVYILIFSIITGNFILPSASGILGATYIGLFEMGVTFVIWMMALKYAHNTARVSNLVYLSPFISLGFVSILVGEKILVSTLIGLALIIGGIILQQYYGRKPTV
ncbi:MAG: DMT family transporter [Lentimicrobium sp.]|nr:DMT family transporter [Lentimicrobium sp.]